MKLWNKSGLKGGNVLKGSKQLLPQKSISVVLTSWLPVPLGSYTMNLSLFAQWGPWGCVLTCDFLATKILCRVNPILAQDSLNLKKPINNLFHVAVHTVESLWTPPSSTALYTSVNLITSQQTDQRYKAVLLIVDIHLLLGILSPFKFKRVTWDVFYLHYF